MNVILIVILVILLGGSAPVWNHSTSWGYLPSGGIGLILLVVVVLALMGKL